MIGLFAGPTGDWLAVIGILAIIYVGWRLLAALIRFAQETPGEADAPAVPVSGRRVRRPGCGGVVQPAGLRPAGHRRRGGGHAGQPPHRASRGSSARPGLDRPRAVDAPDVAPDPLSPRNQRERGTMQKTFRITVEGRSYNVLVEDLTDQTPHPAALVRVAAPRPPVAAPAAAPAPAPAAPPPVDAGPGAVVAPLSGVIYAIDAARPGREAGDQLATIEAMKMKTDVLAKAAGTVGSIAVKVQDSVETGQVLMTLT